MILTVTEILGTYDRKPEDSPKAPIKKYNVKFDNNTEGTVPQFEGGVAVFIGMKIEKYDNKGYTNYRPLKGQQPQMESQKPITIADIPDATRFEPGATPVVALDTNEKIMVQSAWRGACDLFSGTENTEGAIDAMVRAFKKQTGRDL